MTINVPLSPETLAKLRARAAAGKDLETFVRETVEQKVGRMEADAPPEAIHNTRQWLIQLDEWIAGFPDAPHPVDDSRESIYAGRGE